MHKRMIFSLVSLLTLVIMMPVSAQDNLLQNGGFEAERYNRVSVSADGVHFNVPIAWGGVSIVQEGGPVWQNIQPNGFPHTANFVHSGARSYNISRGWATFTAYIYQTVAVVPDTAVRGGAFAYMQSHPSGVARVGIDPTGGVNPFAPTVIWTESYDKNRWIQLEVSATAQADFVTLFLFATQAEWSNPNDIYWDDAYLLGQAGNPETLPGTAPEASTDTAAPPSSDVLESILSLNVRTGPGLNFERIGQIHPGTTHAILGEENGWYQITFNGQSAWVYGGYVRVTQGTASPAQAEGGCVANYTIQRGDTLSAISRRYGVSLDAIAAENSILDYSRLSVGQVLCIPAAAGATQAGSGDAAVGSADGNWCNPGQPWDDGRCIIPDDPAAQEHMWRCGWFRAHDLEVEGC